MMSKNGLWIGLGVIVLLLIAGGAYAAYHNASMTPAPKASTTQSTTTTTPSTNSAPNVPTTPAVSNSVVMTKTASSGSYLTDPSGRALYTYSGDTAGVSNCTGSCLANWPAYQATATTNLPTNISTIKRTDTNQTQYTYKGMPLYYFASDTNGQATGDGVSGFSLARP